MSDVLAVKGKVYPVTLDDVVLCAKLADGSIIKGESNIPKECTEKNEQIQSIFLEPSNPKPLEEALFAIDNADCIIIGPGSLYTSILPNLVIDGVANRIKDSKALKIYVSNIMTQPGETDGYSLSKHINAIENHCGKGMTDFAIANNGKISETYFEKYKNDGQDIVKVDYDNIPKGIEVICDDFVYIKDGLLRHDTKKLSKVIMKIILKHVIAKNRRRILDYYYLSERIKDKQKEAK
jgi:uncharacterized cofD-like protein